MDWNDSPEQATFRKEVRDFIAAKLPKRYQVDEEGYESPYDWFEDRKSGDPEAQLVVSALGRLESPEQFGEIVVKTASSWDWAFDVLPVKCAPSRHGQSIMLIHFAASWLQANEDLNVGSKGKRLCWRRRCDCYSIYRRQIGRS